MKRTLLTLENILGLLSAKQQALFARQSPSNLEQFEAVTTQNRLLGAILSQIDDAPLNILQKKQLFSKVLGTQESQHRTINGESSQILEFPTSIAIKKVENESHYKRYKNKLRFHQIISTSLTASLLVVSFVFYQSTSNQILPERLLQNQSINQNKNYAVLKSEENSATWYVDITGEKLTLIPVSLYRKSETNDLQLWAITNQQKVVSLGIIPDGRLMKLNIKQLQELTEQGISTIAISFEKLGGSTSGQPQGKVIYASEVKQFATTDLTEI